MPAHQKDTKGFGELTYAEQAHSITAMLNNIQAAIEHHVQHSPQRKETTDKCIRRNRPAVFAAVRRAA